MNTYRRLWVSGICAVVVGGSAIAEGASVDGPPNHQGMEGTWMIGVASGVNNGIPFLGIGTYTLDGRYLGESNTTTIKSLEHGEWFQAGPNEYVRTSINFRFSPPPAPSRTFEGVTRISAKMILNDAGDEYTGMSVTQRYDIAGNLISTFIGTEAARRCDTSTTIERCLGAAQ